jgi:hypothetical protein
MLSPMALDDEEAALAAHGIRLATDEDLVDVHMECIRIARGIHHEALQVVGLLPASDDVGVLSFGLQLGLALAEVSRARVAVVDADVRWPALSSGEPAAADGAFTTHWLRGSLALLTPTHVDAAGAGVPQLAKVIAQGAERFAHLLIDLTGFERLGEHLTAVELTHAVLLVGRAGHTRERELLRLSGELRPEQNLGVVLVG